MVTLMLIGLGVWSLVVGEVQSTIPGFGFSAAYRPKLTPLAVIAESPYSVAKNSVDVPLLVVDSSALTMIKNARISAVSPTEPLVTCKTGNPKFPLTDAMPAVQVVLKKPMFVSPEQHSVPFPREVSVLYGGLRLGMPVGAIIAPVPPRGLDEPHLVRVVYAIPSGPLPLQYPYYDPFTYRSPIYPQTQVLPMAPFLPNFAPSTFFTQATSPSLHSYSPSTFFTQATFPSIPPSFSPSALLSPAPTTSLQEMTNVIADVKKPKPPVVTVLNFPSSIASPEVLFYQPPLDDSELGNRGPPEAIVPAGIIQSSQPVASLESFLNSKESPVLNALREQAEKNKDKEDEENEGVLAL